jgi:4-hydroxythreonine-4-phosphate dehydrogenase
MQQKPIIGITVGDLNGIGPEVIIKAVADNRILDMCIPVIFGSTKLINFYKKSITDGNFSFNSTKDWNKIHPKQVNVFNCWEDEVNFTPGQLTEAGGKYAVQALQSAVDALKLGNIHGLVTAPIHKKNVQAANFPYSGHTPFLRHEFGTNNVVMLMVAENLRVAVLSEHVPIAEAAKHVTKENIVSALQTLNKSLQRDFGIDKPKIAVLGLNPHAGDEGLIGEEEIKVIKPAIQAAKDQGILALGPYSADAFFARHHFNQFDAVLAMYHDQGLIPFKSLATGNGTNFSAGLPIVRTSPDHGTAFDIAGQGKADAHSMLSAIYSCVDIIRQQEEHDYYRRDPLKKITSVILANAVDEKIEEEPDGL